MQNKFDNEGFINSINTIKQLPREQWMGFVKNKYQLKNQDITPFEKQAIQIMQSKNPQLALFSNMINSQFGIRF